MVQIANPIYDVVFKYLMKDKKVAKLLLSAITGQDIIELDFRPTEFEVPVGQSLMVVRMDFSARVRDAEGEERLIIIELQKAKLATDIMRFRRYLGEQYMNRDNVIDDIANGSPHKKALPIISIYFLGHKLDHCTSPVIRVKRHYLDGATNGELSCKEEFIESLTHDSYIIQIPYLKDSRRTELEQLLGIFDQSHKSADAHFLTIEDEDVPKRYRPLIRRLQQALADTKVKQTMIAEDEILEELKDYQRLIANKDKTIQEKDLAIQEKEQAIQEKDQAIQEKDWAIQEKDWAIQEKDQAIQEKERTLEQQQETIIKAIMQLQKAGMNTMQIASALSLPLELVEKILSK